MAMPSTDKRMAPHSSLELLSKLSVVVADTGDIESMKQYSPQDSTTNPSLLLQSAKLPQYAKLVDAAVAYGKERGGSTEEAVIDAVCDKLAVSIGVEILKIVPGVVSTEVDARHSFDTAASVVKAEKLIAMYEEAGIGRDRVLIKMASTWAGCRAAELLEAKGIHCNMTLLFCLVQARAAAEAGATLISPFVGRILDWHKVNTKDLEITQGSHDPGVKSVKSIYTYYKQHQYPTIIMGASFRNVDEILALAGCDKLTISPKLLNELAAKEEAVVAVLDASKIDAVPRPDKSLTEAEFMWGMNEDRMASEKLAEGIRGFHSDGVKLRDLIKSKL